MSYDLSRDIFIYLNYLIGHDVGEFNLIFNYNHSNSVCNSIRNCVLI